MKRLLCIAVIAAVAATAVSAAQGQQAGRWPKFWEQKKRVENLGLSPDQVSKLAEIDLKYSMAAIDLRAKVQAARLNFDHLIGKAEMDEKAITDLIVRIADARRQQIAHNLQRMVDVRKILTPEQWNKVSRILAREKIKRRERGRDEKGPAMKGGERMREGEEGRGPSAHGKWGRPMMKGGMGGPGVKSMPAGPTY